MAAQNTFKNQYVMGESQMPTMPACRSRLFSRRQALLIGGGAAALAVAGVPWPAAAIGRIEAGDAEITIVSDGHLVLPAPFVLPDVPEADRSAILSGNGMSTETLNPDCNISFVRSGDRLAIFDVGSGPNFMPSAGKLLENLTEAEIDPADVTDVIFTHAHPDHFWGLTDEFDELIFSNATYRMAEAEWNFWRADDTLEKMPEDRKSFVVGAQGRMPLIEEKIELFTPGTEVFPQVEVVDTPGHTPGHVSFMVHGGSDPVLIVGDVLANPVSFARPDWHWGTDHDPEIGSATRRKLLDRIATEKVRLIGFHLPHPGAGTAEAHDGAYRFVPAG
jgi:glyoxylase-like metal-dependent hydrolase (beta-lactamase superfamily II)